MPTWEETLTSSDGGNNTNTSNSTAGEQGSVNLTDQATPDTPIENRYNDVTQYWTPEEETVNENISTDTPTVRIFISREIVKSDEEGEEGSSESLEEVADKESWDINKLFSENPNMTTSNTSVISDKNGNKILAMNAIDEFNQARKKREQIDKLSKKGSTATPLTSNNQWDSKKQNNIKKEIVNKVTKKNH